MELPCKKHIKKIDWIPTVSGLYKRCCKPHKRSQQEFRYNTLSYP
jgi:hypothetical protein